MYKYLSSHSTIITAIGTLISILGIACTTTEKVGEARESSSPELESKDLDSKSSDQVLFYQLTRGEKIENPELLPDYIPFYLKVVGSKGVKEEYLKYRGWDFDKDDIIDMLEELSPDGERLGEVFDFENSGYDEVWSGTKKIDEHSL